MRWARWAGILAIVVLGACGSFGEDNPAAPSTTPPTTNDAGDASAAVQEGGATSSSSSSGGADALPPAPSCESALLCDNFDDTAGRNGFSDEWSKAPDGADGFEVAFGIPPAVPGSAGNAARFTVANPSSSLGAQQGTLRFILPFTAFGDGKTEIRLDYRVLISVATFGFARVGGFEYNGSSLHQVHAVQFFGQELALDGDNDTKPLPPFLKGEQNVWYKATVLLSLQDKDRFRRQVWLEGQKVYEETADVDLKSNGSFVACIGIFDTGDQNPDELVIWVDDVEVSAK